MSADPAALLLSDFDRLFERERGALLEGRFEGLAGLLEEKRTLIERLERLGADARPALGALRDKAARNQVLIDGALHGLRRVSSHVSEMRQVRRTFDTYDEAGRRRPVEDGPAGSTQKRA